MLIVSSLQISEGHQGSLGICMLIMMPTPLLVILFLFSPCLIVYLDAEVTATPYLYTPLKC